jgi:hypothetical protein
MIVSSVSSCLTSSCKRRTGLGIVEAIGALNTHLEQEQGIRLAVRVGIYTGLVVVGEIGGGKRQKQLALGETPNIAARIQGLAPPDTVVISVATYRLVQGYFLTEDRGPHALKGIAAPQQVYRVVEESSVQSRLEIVSIFKEQSYKQRMHEASSSWPWPSATKTLRSWWKPTTSWEPRSSSAESSSLHSLISSRGSPSL